MVARMKARNIRVGLFVLGGMLFSALVIFLIGDERRLFERSVPFTAEFGDVQGLKASAPIRMGGVDIGHVSAVAYSNDPGDSTICRHPLHRQRRVHAHQGRQRASRSPPRACSATR